MVKTQHKTIGVIAVLLMLSASPLSVTYAFADTEQDKPETESAKKEKLGAILTEKVVDGM